MVKPSSRSRNSYYSDDDDDEKSNPQFFKIFIPRHCSKHLRIPPAFIKYFKGILPSKSILRTPAKRSWRIDMKKVDNYFFFLKGWPEFVRDNSLVFGDFLIFCYTGNLEFYVTIFGKNNCQKEVLITATDDDEPQPLLQRIQTDGPCESEERMCIDSVEMDTSMPVPDNIGALETPRELGTKKPFFEIVLKTCVHTSSIYIPSKFVESYMSTHRQTARLTHSNKSWLVRLLRCGNLLVFSGGWRKFVADNTLREGDVCSFELICRNDYTFNVVILRGNGTTPDKAQGKSKVMEGSKRTVEVNIEDASSKFNSEHPFFQIVLTLASMRTFLCIPSKFQKSYINEPRATARLQYGNKSWVVNMRPYKHSRLVFSVGWSKFVKQNSLQVGNFCSFELIEKENYVFKVSISRGKSEEIECLNSREEGTKRTVEANVEDASTKFISKHPFFQIVLSPACMRHFLGIPSKFQKSYINEPRETATLQYSNKRWVVNLITCKDGRLLFSGGWSKFMKQNSLQVGDVCSFELIEKENYVFMVSISRGKSKEIRGLEDAFDKFTSKHPFFHVVLSPSSASRRLCIPSKFWTSYIDQPRATARLQCSNQWWMVGLRGYGHGSYFLGGWSKFAKENSLQLGDACCFELIEKENYAFMVSISRGKSKEIGGLEDAFDKFTSKHPFFHVVLSPSSVSRHLCIPSKFWTSYIDQPRATARLQCSNQWWMVDLRGYGHGSYFLGGWSKFAKENSLQLGDACCFELIEKENYVFKVSIARGIKNSTPTKA